MGQNPLVHAIVGVQFLPIHTGNLPNPAILQVTMDIVGEENRQMMSLTVEAASQLVAKLSGMLQSLDSR